MISNTRSEHLRRIVEAADALKAQGAAAPEVAVILGSGLAGASPSLQEAKTVEYSQIPGFPAPTVSGHAGRLVLGRAGNLGAAVMQGRFHYYEGHPLDAVTLPVRVLHRLGVRTLVITAAVGSLRPRFKPGHLVFLKDHINLMGVNPLRGLHTREFGEMFPDLAGVYTAPLRKQALKLCRKLSLPAGEGVYTAVAGPSYETPAEIQAFRRLGGDVVGMSVVPEVIAAAQLGMRVLAFGWVSNLGAGLTKANLSHPDVLALGQRVGADIRRFLEAVLPTLGR
ncbi:MAG: purine-nucleoside phosphorylase [Elusimicrobiota bacterium]|jgi:purine-nucleoside phosphorylase